jgi:hypothetical protein
MENQLLAKTAAKYGLCEPIFEEGGLDDLFFDLYMLIL